MRFSRLLFITALIFCVIKFVHLALTMPLGGWDAWMTWTLKAKFIAATSPHLYSTHMVHPDYPLFISSVIAFFWRVIGYPAQIIPILFSALFTFGTVGSVYYSIRHWRNEPFAEMFCSILLLSPGFLITGAAQVADVPLGFFNLATVIAFYIYSERKDIRWLIICGLCAGVSLNTKNEGAVFVLGFGLVYVISWMKNPRLLVVWGASFFLMTIPYLILKIHFAPPNQYINDNTLISQFSEIQRFGTIGLYFLHRGALLFVPLSIAIVYLATKYPLKLTFNRLFLLIGFILGMYFVAYVITPYDLVGQIEASLDRLYLHIWPLALLAIAFMLKPVIPVHDSSSVNRVA